MHIYSSFLHIFGFQVSRDSSGFSAFGQKNRPPIFADRSSRHKKFGVIAPFLFVWYDDLFGKIEPMK